MVGKLVIIDKKHWPYLVNKEGAIFSLKSQKKVKGCPTTRGHKRLTLSLEGMKKNFQVSHLVLMAWKKESHFLGAEAHHINENNKDALPRFSFMTKILKCFSHMTKALRLNDLQ